MNIIAGLRNGGIFMEQEFSKNAKTVQHRGVEIFITDYSGLKALELAEAMKENAKVIVPRVIGRRDAVMVNIFKNCQFDEDSFKYITKIQKAMAGTFVASALVGMTDFQRMGLEITGALSRSGFATKYFDDEKEAMDWVAGVYRKVVNERHSGKP